jgi:hypothetical protein
MISRRPTGFQRHGPLLPRRGALRCLERQLDRRLRLLLLPARPAPELRRRILEAVKRD